MSSFIVLPAGSQVERLFLHQGTFRFSLGQTSENKREVELTGSVFPQVWPLLEDRARLQRPEQQIPPGNVPGGGRAPVPGLCSQILLPGKGLGVGKGAGNGELPGNAQSEQCLCLSLCLLHHKE